MLHPKLKALRDDLYTNAITYSEFAKCVGVSESKIKKIFSGKQEVTLGFYDTLINAKLKLMIEKRSF